MVGQSGLQTHAPCKKMTCGASVAFISECLFRALPGFYYGAWIDLRKFSGRGVGVQGLRGVGV